MATVQTSGMLSREQLLHLFRQFSLLASKPDVKKRIKDAVNDKQEAVAVTTAIQEEIFRDMGVDPRFGISCLGKVNVVYENDSDLMIRFYGFVAKEELVCDEAEMEPDAFAEKMRSRHNLHEQQLEMLKLMRKHPADEQSFILEMLRLQMEHASFDSHASVLTEEQVREIAQSRRYGV